MSEFSPIALFVYNRPDHTQRTLDALGKNPLASESDLYIYSDGFKDDASAPTIERVREVVHDVGGFKSVTVIKREKNWGLAASIIAGVTELTDRFGRVIVVEDDLITSPQFLEHMNAALDHYKDDDKVMQIAGHTFLEPKKDSACVAMPISNSWGWATWKRAWEYFDPDATGYKNLINNRKLRNQFDINGAYPYSVLLEKQVLGESDSWAIRWYLSMFKHDGLCIYPPCTLLENIGFDGSGTHCRDAGSPDLDIAFQKIEIGNFPKSKTTPGALQLFAEALRKNLKQIEQPSLFDRAKHLLKTILVDTGMLKK